ncbi:MAG: pantothenate kinase [Oscillospiraceae bacterium]|nr:pantothenate kinase [Oscillospiraceae bacterium]
MNIKLGIDIGGSTTKIVGISVSENGGAGGQKCVGMLQVRAADQVTSMYGAIGNFLRTHKLGTSDVSEIYLTGVGASFIDEQVYGIKTLKVSEFAAIGRGALIQSGLKEALAVSMGTGTAFVRADENGSVHIGGTGIGGGTIIGLSSELPCRNDINAILTLAEKGDLNNVDLFVDDIVSRDIDTLPRHLTAANFGKLKSVASDSDIALGIVNMVFETVGMMVVFALRNDTVKDAVITGTLATFPQAKHVFSKVTEVTGINFIIPDDAVFSTALGAVS